MPFVKGKYSMNPAVARAKAKYAEPDADERGGASDKDDDELIPRGHKFSGTMSVKATDNGGGTVEHSTEPIAPPKKGEDSWSRRQEHNNAFASAEETGAHVTRLLKAHHGRGKK